MRGEQGVSESVKAKIGTDDAEFREKALDTLTGVTNEGATGYPFCGFRVGSNAKHLGGSVELATIKDRVLIEPEMLLERRVVGDLSEQISPCGRRTGFEV